MITRFLPKPRLGLRLAAYGALTAFGLLGSATPVSKVIWMLGMAFVLGTYRESRIREGHFERRMVFAFLPLRWTRWPLEQFVAIETRYASSSPLGSILPLAAFNLFYYLWGWFFDWLFPWLGGSYELRLKLDRSGRVLVWKGNSDTNFLANLKLLEARTGLPPRRV